MRLLKRGFLTGGKAAGGLMAIIRGMGEGGEGDGRKIGGRGEGGVS